MHGSRVKIPGETVEAPRVALLTNFDSAFLANSFAAPSYALSGAYVAGSLIAAPTLEVVFQVSFPFRGE